MGESWEKKTPKFWDTDEFKGREQAEAGAIKPVTEAGHKHLSIPHIPGLPFPFVLLSPDPGSNPNRSGLKAPSPLGLDMENQAGQDPAGHHCIPHVLDLSFLPMLPPTPPSKVKSHRDWAPGSWDGHGEAGSTGSHFLMEFPA